jgi:hypothetical protein
LTKQSASVFCVCCSVVKDHSSLPFSLSSRKGNMSIFRIVGHNPQPLKNKLPQFGYIFQQAAEIPSGAS